MENLLMKIGTPEFIAFGIPLIVAIALIIKLWNVCNDIHSIKLILEKKYGKDYK